MWAYDKHDYHMLPVAIKRATELHLFIHSVSSLVGISVTVSFDSVTRGDLKCLERSPLGSVGSRSHCLSSSVFSK